MGKQHYATDFESIAKSLKGWYAYAWAAEVFVVCGVGESLCCLRCLRQKKSTFMAAKWILQLTLLM